MAFGITETGFVRKTQADIIAEINEEMLSRISSRLNLQAETPLGQINGIFSERLAEVWELLEEVVHSTDPDNATGFLLRQVSAITGTRPQAATKGTVTLRLTLNDGALVAAGSIAQVEDQPTNRWVTLADVENTSGITDDFDVEAEAETAGPFVANAGTISEIVTPASGWTAVTNPLDADPGEPADDDPGLRIRREAELAKAGSATVRAIRADVLQVEGVETVRVFNNPSDVTDGDGLPPHSVEVLVLGGDDQEVAEAIFATVGAGIYTHGVDSAVVEDDEGLLHTVRYTRPTQILIYLEIDVDCDSLTIPDDVDGLIRTDVAEFGEEQQEVGDDVVIAHLHVPVFGVQSVEDVTEIRVGIAPSPVQTTNYVIGVREIARLDTTRIVVNVTEV